VKSVQYKSLEQIKTDLKNGVKLSLDILNTGLEEHVFSDWLSNEETRLKDLLKTKDWKNEFQGKIIFSMLCTNFLKVDPIRIRHAYVDIALAEKPKVFEDIFMIFKSFNFIPTETEDTENMVE
jgi:hypothetical protein